MDPGILPEQLEEASNILEAELNFLMQLFEAKHVDEDQEMEKQILEEENE